MNLTDALETTQKRLDEMVAKYSIKAIYALFSGGDDSTIMSYLVSKHPLFKGVIFANTLTGDKETIDYVHETARLQGWELNEVKPNINDRYPTFIATHGIPTPAMHPMIFGNLKGKPFDAFAVKTARKLRCKRKEILLVSGIRRAESTKRMRTVQMVKEISSDKGKSIRSVFGAPIFDWQRQDLEDIFATGVIARNQHAYKFGASRECGCHSTEGEQDPILEKQFHAVAWERRKLQYELARAAYALQEFEVANGLIDRQDATIPSYGVRELEKQLQLFPYRYDDTEQVGGVPFFCVGCEKQEGTDIDKELWVVKQHKLEAA